MSIYKLTCAETGKIYYGSTGNDIKKRENKGWYKCSCKDFINPKLEVLEHVEDETERLIRENYYIENFDCVNHNRSVGLTQKEYQKEYRIKNKEKRKEDNRLHRQKVIDEKRYYCSLCNVACITSKALTKHSEGYRHQLKQQSFNKYGDSWKEHYIIDNKKKYQATRKLLNKV